MVTDYLGADLLRQSNAIRVNRRTAMTVAADLFDCLIDLHKQDLVHGDVKPENVMWRGLREGSALDRVSLIDYGFTEFFRNPVSQRIRKEESVLKAWGTYAYASLNTINKMVNTQRDDAISAFYTVLAVEGKFGLVDAVARSGNAAKFESNMLEWLSTPTPVIADPVFLHVWQILRNLEFGEDIPRSVPQLFRARARELSTPYGSVRETATIMSTPVVEGLRHKLDLSFANGILPEKIQHRAAGTYLVRAGGEMWTLAYGPRLAENVYKGVSLVDNGKMSTLSFGSREDNCRHLQYNEANILSALQSSDSSDHGIPQMTYFGDVRLASEHVRRFRNPTILIFDNHFYRNLASVRRRKVYRWSSNARRKKSSMRGITSRHACAAGLQLLDTLQFMHDNHIIYNAPITPDVIFVDSSRRNVYLTGFTRAKYYTEINDVSGKLVHIDDVDLADPPEPSLFSSTMSMLGYAQSRRDDLESLAYTLIHMMGVDLGPLRSSGTLEQYLRSKTATAPFAKYLKEISMLSFKDEPNYQLLANLLKIRVRGNEKF